MERMIVNHDKNSPQGPVGRAGEPELAGHLTQMIRGYMPSRCILTALELDLFTAIGGGSSAAQAASRIGTNPRATEMLLNALVALGLLEKQGEQFKNTGESQRFFAGGSKDNQRNGLLHGADLWHRWSTLTEVVRTGKRISFEGDRSAEWTRNFIAAMQHNARNRAPFVVEALGTQGVRRILDLGGGSAIYSIAFARASSEAQCEILDLPAVVPLTREYLADAGLSARISVRTGDMFAEDLGSGWDLIMLNAICHMFSEEQNRELFRRARHALAPKGRLAVQDFILRPDKTQPLQAALFSINMLVGTDSGASYSEPEYTHWMKEAGFDQIRWIDMPGPSDLIVGQVL